ncbi:D-alanyl-alanine synthetase [Leptolyngbya valderiana BDU 20041]|nr:D-alanyl-alanine synthetase [Geitlerinema sp. CS-897]OAB55073.1 D-alanyl-alanine synthetase [Leptolyngbya valderiana BDU 20041]PPT10291.1 D-alanine--D-alanine ligase B [Geitlerinema sp. FC II]
MTLDLTELHFTYSFDRFPDYLDRLRSKLRIAVIHGGDKDRDGAVIYKTHNPRSTKTYEKVAWDIAEALKNLGFEYVSVMPDDMTLPQRLKEENIHLAWLNTGGVQGYDPVCHTPAILEMLGVPYVGHDPLNSSTLDNKHVFKRELQAFGVRTAPFMTWHPSQGILNPHTNPRFLTTFGHYRGAFVVKPVSGRASLNIFVVDDAADLPDAVAEVHRLTRNTASIETYLSGREFCVSVCGYVTCAGGTLRKNPEPFAFSTIERVLEANERIFTSMDRRAITEHRLRLLGNEDADMSRALISLAKQVYWDFNLNALVRIDLRTDADGKLYVLEANPKPDLKRPTEAETSLVVQGLREYGMEYEDLILSLLVDRLDYLLTYHAPIVRHLVALLV